MAPEHAEVHGDDLVRDPTATAQTGLSRRVYGRIMLICAWLDLVLLLAIGHLLFLN